MAETPKMRKLPDSYSEGALTHLLETYGEMWHQYPTRFGLYREMARCLRKNFHIIMKTDAEKDAES